MDRTIAELKSRITGNVIVQGDDAYETRRGVLFNRTAKPLVIVECKTADDVALAVNTARDAHITLSVRSGGHSGAGLSSNTDGCVIDLRLLNQVDVVNAQEGIVHVGAGATWGEVAHTLQPYNLAISSGDTKSVGVGGLTLGGGIGWMVRTVGLSIDRLEAVELVLASGEIVRATADKHPDLFWAIRGGGGNVGIATTFEFRAVPCRSVLGGKLVYAATDLETVLTKWSAYMKTAPETLNSTVLLLPGFGPDPKPQVIVIVCCADQDEDAAEKAVQPLRELAPMVHDTVARIPYVEMLEDIRMMDGIKVRVRNGFVTKISPELIHEVVQNFCKPGAPMMQIRSLGGAMARVSSDAMAFEHRGAEALIIMNAMFPQGQSDGQVYQEADAQWASIQPFVHGSYVGFQTDNSPRSTDEAYIASRHRLTEVKLRYDPGNLFNQNTNIIPTA